MLAWKVAKAADAALSELSQRRWRLVGGAGGARSLTTPLGLLRALARGEVQVRNIIPFGTADGPGLHLRPLLLPFSGKGAALRVVPWPLGAGAFLNPV